MNRQAKTRVGSCPKCRKLVTLGKATEKEIAATAGATGTGAGSRSGKEEKGKEKKAAVRAKTKTTPAARRTSAAKPGSVQARSDVPAKRAGVGSAVRRFFDL